MRNETGVSDKFHEFRKHLFNGGRIHDHGICNTGKFRNFKRDRNLWIYKRTVPFHNLAMLYLNCSNLNDPVSYRTKTCRLNIKYNIGII